MLVKVYVCGCGGGLYVGGVGVYVGVSGWVDMCMGLGLSVGV